MGVIQSKLKSSGAVLEFLRAAGFTFGVRVAPLAVQYEQEKQNVTDRIIARPHMTRQDLDKMSREADKALESLEQRLDIDGPR